MVPRRIGKSACAASSGRNLAPVAARFFLSGRREEGRFEFTYRGTPTMKPYLCCCTPLLLAVLSAAAAGEPIKIDIYDQRVAIVNTEAISKRDVEDRMQGMAEKLYGFKKEKMAMNVWTPELDADWTQTYVKAFQFALRDIVRERLMLQHFAIEKMSIDDKAFQKRLAGHLDMLRKNKYIFNVADVTKVVREQMMLEEFGGKFDNQLEFPKRPEVEAYYKQNIEKYQRKAGVKIRVIRIDLSVEDKLTGNRKVRENAYGMLEDIRRDIVEFGALFAEVAKAKTDDPDLRERGGLIVGSNGDPYISVDDYNKVLANATRDLQVGEVSKIFEYGKGYAIALLEDRREAGPAPLEGALYEQIYNEMYKAKKKKKEDEWFRATLSKTLVMQIIEGKTKALDIDFFFPDDAEKKRKEKADFVSGQPAPGEKKDEKKGGKKDENKYWPALFRFLLSGGPIPRTVISCLSS